MAPFSQRRHTCCMAGQLQLENTRRCLFSESRCRVTETEAVSLQLIRANPSLYDCRTSVDHRGTEEKEEIVEYGVLLRVERVQLMLLNLKVHAEFESNQCGVFPDLGYSSHFCLGDRYEVYASASWYINYPPR